MLDDGGRKPPGARYLDVFATVAPPSLGQVGHRGLGPLLQSLAVEERGQAPQRDVVPLKNPGLQETKGNPDTDTASKHGAEFTLQVTGEPMRAQPVWDLNKTQSRSSPVSQSYQSLLPVRSPRTEPPPRRPAGSVRPGCDPPSCGAPSREAGCSLTSSLPAQPCKHGINQQRGTGPITQIDERVC